MGAGNVLPERGIKVKIAGEEKILKFTMGSLAWLADRHGNINNAFQTLASVDGLASGILSAKDLHTLADIMCAALMYSDKDITPETIESSMDIVDIIEALPGILEAFKASMNVKKETKKKNPPKA
jgi:hypothetical protein